MADEITFAPTVPARTSELTAPRSLKASRAVTGWFQPTNEIDALEGTAEALAFNVEGPSSDWTYSATAEGLTGEVAVNGIDMDLEPGLIYAGPIGASAAFQIELDLKAGQVAPEAADDVTLGVFRNNDLIAHAPEGFVSELDTETAEFTLQGTVDNLQTGDVLRVGVIAHAGNEDAVEYATSGHGLLIIS